MSQSRVTSSLVVTTNSHFANLDIYLDQEPPATADMSPALHESYRRAISCDPAASSPAPVHKGQPHGYFDDEAMRTLLGLEADAVPLHSGTYGEKEPSIKPVKLSLLRQKLRDQLLLPLVPKNHWFHHTLISMYEKLQQYAVHLEACRELGWLFSKSLLDGQIGMNETSLNYPNYARVLVLRLQYKTGGDDEPFFYQFQIFFLPSAHRIRAARIGQVCAMLDAMTNLVQALQKDPGEWEKGTPIGIVLDSEDLTEDNRTLVNAYRSLDVPVEGTLPNNLPPIVTAEQARIILFGKPTAKFTDIPDKIELPDRHDDALFYADIQPNHDALGLHADGSRKLAAELRAFTEEEYIQELQEARGAQEEPTAMDLDPAPPYSAAASAAAAAFGTLALQVLLVEASGNASVGTPQQALTPVSAVTSIQSSEGASAVSSRSVASNQPEGSRPCHKSTVTAQRSRNWKGRHRKPPPCDQRSPPRQRSPSPHCGSRSPHRHSPVGRLQHSPPR